MIIDNDYDVAENLNSFFKDAVSSLEIKRNSDILKNVPSNMKDLIELAICKYEVHRSILIIKDKIKPSGHFSFSHIAMSDVNREIYGVKSK